MSRRNRIVRNWIEAGLVHSIFALLRFLPRRARLAAGKGLGLGLYALSPRHRRVARSNLDRAFGETIPPAEKTRIARASFAHLGLLLCDSLAFTRVDPRRLDRVAILEGLEHLKTAYDKGKGAFVFSGHYGNWEMAALIQGYLGLPLAMVTRPLDNPFLEKMMFRYRTLSGNKVIHKRGAAREILRAIRQGWGVAIVIDQNVRGEDGIFVDFFGTPASTTPALATLALKTEAPIVPVFCVPLPDGRYRIRYQKEVEFHRTGDTRRDILELTQVCTRIIEEQVKREPEYWVWVHRRWRTRPPEERAAEPARRAEA
jgi:Kdo2-lipid IVA lauroyltransferase/acyltransferase